MTTKRSAREVVSKQMVSEIEVARAMEDQAARFDSMGRLQKRNFILQQLLSKVQGLPDEEFEMAFATFESLIESLEARKKQRDEAHSKDKSKPRDLLGEVGKKITQNRGTTI